MFAMDSNRFGNRADVATKLRHAFPSGCEAGVNASVRLFPNAEVYSAYDFDVSIAGEGIRIPGRFIYDGTGTLSRHYSAHWEDAKQFAKDLHKWFASASIGERQRIILACLLTRHSNGFVRETFARDVVCVAEMLVAPYVLELVGERVCPIINVVSSHLESVDPDIYAEFAKENREFVDLTRQRVISHWSELHRKEFPSFRQYPGFQVLDALGLWPTRYARRLLLL